MQRNSASTKSSTEILKLAIQFIGQHNVTAIPINYTVSYEYCRGEHILLRQAIDQAINYKQPITDGVMQRWFDTFLLGYDLNEISESQLDLNKIASQLARTTTQAEENVNVADMPRGHFERVHQAGFAIDTDVELAAEKPLIAFLAGMHFWVT
jgi:diguanylate cyclase